MVRKHIDRTLA